VVEHAPGADHISIPPTSGGRALMTAHMRAVESVCEDRLFTDPLAMALVEMMQRSTCRIDGDDVLPTGPARLAGPRWSTTSRPHQVEPWLVSGTSELRPMPRRGTRARAISARRPS
jgi:O-methyltransferase involved in polyketide biosynthesis